MTINDRPFLTGLATVLTVFVVFSYFALATQAQNDTSFTPADKFSIPRYNGTISFAVNGSYAEATLGNNTWNFRNLTLNNSQPLGTLRVSAENSNITILSYRANNTFFRSAILRYTVKGQGKQTVNLGINSSQASASEWSVIVPNNIFLAEGEGWNLLPDNTVVITCATSNVTVVHYALNVPVDSNLPFHQQHSIAIITAITVTATVTTAVVIKARKRK